MMIKKGKEEQKEKKAYRPLVQGESRSLKLKQNSYFFLVFRQIFSYRKEYIFNKKYVFKLLFSNTKDQVLSEVEVILIDKAQTFTHSLTHSLPGTTSHAGSWPTQEVASNHLYPWPCSSNF
jgi:hypothetical protein